MIQHQSYIDALTKCGLDVHVLDPCEEYPDSTFVEDVALITPKCAIIMRPGAHSRRGEVHEIEFVLKQRFNNIEAIEAPGTIDGGDIMSDVFIGRMSVRNTSTLNTVCNKIIQYEKATYIGSTGSDWYESAALIGDPSSSGISTVITNEYIAEILNAYGFEDINEKYSGGSWSSWMQNSLSDGVSYFNYRGYWLSLIHI